MTTAISAIIIFCLIIFIHELGHFVSAKLFGMTVHEFSIGMGPRIFGWTKKGTQYCLRALPLGGFVKLEGEDGSSDDLGAFCNKGKFARFVVLSSGAIMNFVLGFLLFVIIMSFAQGYATNKIGTVLPDSAFSQANILPGDVIVRMDSDVYSTSVRTYNDITYFSFRNGNNPADITFSRDGEKFTKTISPLFSESENRFLYGFSAEIEDTSFTGVIKYSFYQSLFVIKIVVNSFIDLIRGTVPASDISGPIGIVGEIGNAAKKGIFSLMNLAALISLNLGVVNLLPLPALDGGRLLFIIIEFIRKKPIPPEKEAFVHGLGFFILLLFMLFVTFMDISKIF